jgi:hypothetical protein
VNRAFALLPFALLAACGAPAPQPGNAEVTVNAANSADVTNAPANVATPPFAEVENAHPTAPEPAPIPAKFRGAWANTGKACADLEHYSRLVISGRTLRFPSHVLFGDSFTFPTPDSFAVKGTVEATGQPAEAHYSLNPQGTLLRDEAGGGTNRVRCA